MIAMARKYSSRRVLSSQPGVTPGHLDTPVALELLQTLQTHPSVERLGGAGMPQTIEPLCASSATSRYFINLFRIQVRG